MYVCMYIYIYTYIHIYIYTHIERERDYACEFVFSMFRLRRQLRQLPQIMRIVDCLLICQTTFYTCSVAH